MPEWLNSLLAGLDEGEVLRRLRARLPHTDGPDEAAVLMLLTGDPSAVTRPADAKLLITHRTPTMRTHSGQMAFPGGRIDPGDADATAAALREAWEETGLARDRVRPLRVLDAVTTGGSNRRVRPVLAYSADPGPTWPASPVETDDVFFVHLDELIAPANRLRVRILGWSGPAFRARDYLIWGFTAGLIDALIASAGWEEPWARSPAVPLRRALRDSRNAERHL